MRYFASYTNGLELDYYVLDHLVKIILLGLIFYLPGVMLGYNLEQKRKDHMSPDTKIDAITDELRRRILAGTYGTQGRLPGLRMLAKEFRTSQETMNKVIQRLQDEGLLSSLGQRGVFVRGNRTRIPGLLPRFDLYLQQMGLEPVEENLEEPALMKAPLGIADLMGVEPDTLVVRRLRRQGSTTAYMRIAENFYPQELAGEFLEQMKADARMDVVEAIKQRHGVVIHQVREDILARLPSKQEQIWLKISRGTPVLEVDRVCLSREGTVIMANRLILVASFFILSREYSVSHWDTK
jgi:GntR family transcriptional regulator